MKVRLQNIQKLPHFEERETQRTNRDTTYIFREALESNLPKKQEQPNPHTNHPRKSIHFDNKRFIYEQHGKKYILVTIYNTFKYS